MIVLREITLAPVLNRLSLRIDKGERVVLCGPSGAGKTTLLRCIAGLAALTQGKIVLSERIVNDGSTTLVPPHERDLSMVFQDLGLWPHLSVLDNVALAVRSASGVRDRRVRAERQLEECLLAGYGNRRLGQLSGGELTRVALARALVVCPKVLLLDEAFTGLDVMLQQELGALITSHAENFGTTIVAVFHDVIAASQISPHRVLCLESGTLLADQRWDEMKDMNPFLKAWSSGRSFAT